MEILMVKPVDMDSRRPETELEARKRSNSFVWVWAVLAIVLILGIGGLMSFAARGLTANTGRLEQDPSYIENVAKGAAKGNGHAEAPPPAPPPPQ
jgi:hypothetical protein